MIVLLWLGLFFIPLVLGMGLLTIFYRKDKSYSITAAEGFVLGSMACVGLTQVGHLAGLFLNVSLSRVGMLLAVLCFFTVAVTLAALIVLFVKQKEKIAFLDKHSQEKSLLSLVFIGLVLLQILFVFCMKPLDTPGDIMLETVQSFLAEDGIYRVMPLTGTVSETGMPLRYEILCLPTLYAVLCRGFQIEAVLLVCHIIPVMVLAGMYFSYYHLSGVLFEKEALKKRYLFMVLVVVLVLFTDSGVFSNGYSALHNGYLGTSVRNLILVPYTVSATLEKRWWKAVLCILTEACITWTLWGCGVCLVIFVVMLFITILESKLPKVHDFMQIFRTKEDLT